MKTTKKNATTATIACSNRQSAKVAKRTSSCSLPPPSITASSTSKISSRFPTKAIAKISMKSFSSSTASTTFSNLHKPSSTAGANNPSKRARHRHSSMRSTQISSDSSKPSPSRVHANMSNNIITIPISAPSPNAFHLFQNVPTLGRSQRAILFRYLCTSRHAQSPCLCAFTLYPSVKTL